MEKFDVIVIGGGVVGTAVLRSLSAYDAKILLLEKSSDVASGASRANSGIVHAGYDAAVRPARPGGDVARLLEEQDLCFIGGEATKHCRAHDAAANHDDVKTFHITAVRISPCKARSLP